MPASPSLEGSLASHADQGLVSSAQLVRAVPLTGRAAPVFADDG